MCVCVCVRACVRASVCVCVCAPAHVRGRISEASIIVSASFQLKLTMSNLALDARYGMPIILIQTPVLFKCNAG